jgi:hypothetical protein
MNVSLRLAFGWWDLTFYTIRNIITLLAMFLRA